MLGFVRPDSVFYRYLYSEMIEMIAEVLAQRGEIEGSLAALDRAWTVRDTGLFQLPTDPFLDPTRHAPRFASLLRNLGFA